MPRQRSISPAFFRHRELYQAEMETKLPLRLAFIGLWTVADREGRFRWRPWEIRLDIMPYDERYDLGAILDALAARGFIRRYVVDGEEFGDIPTFQKHQHVHPKEAPSRCPPCNSQELPGTPSNAKSLPSAVQAFGYSGLQNIKPCKHEPTKLADDPLFDQAWAAYPKRPGHSKALARKAWATRTKEGVDPHLLLAGVQAYARYCRSTKTEPQFIKHASTFLGPDRHWEADWTPPAAAASSPAVYAPYHAKVRPAAPGLEEDGPTDPRVLALVRGLGAMP